MITYIPALDYLHSLCGFYHDQLNDVALRMWRCGYGVAFDLTVQDKSTFCGVAGAYGQDVECFVQCGLPNVMRMLGKKVSESDLRFVDDEFPFEFCLTRKGDDLTLNLILHGKQVRQYQLKAVDAVGKHGLP